jgi:hypothetical protein
MISDEPGGNPNRSGWEKKQIIHSAVKIPRLQTTMDGGALPKGE